MHAHSKMLLDGLYVFTHLLPQNLLKLNKNAFLQDKPRNVRKMFNVSCHLYPGNVKKR